MKESFGEHNHTTSGEALAKHAEGITRILPVTDSRVQVFLIRHAFPSDPDAMEKWLEEDSRGETLSGKFRTYIEDSSRTSSELEVDVSSPEALDALFRAVQNYVSEQTIH